MSQIKKNNPKSIRAEKKPRSTPLILPRYPQEAKKLEEVNAMLERAVLLPHHSEGRVMIATKNDQQKNISKETKPRTTPKLLPRNEREAKKLAEINEIIDKMIFLPDETDASTPKKKH